jgi:hypothetical protein
MRECLLLEVLVDHTALVVCRVVTTTKDATDIAGVFLAGAFTCQIGTGAFNASWCVVPVIFYEPVSLTVGTLCNVFFCLFGRFKCDFALLKVFYLKYVLIVWGRFETHKKHRELELSFVLLDIVDIGDCMAEVLDFVFNFLWVDWKVHIFSTSLYLR